MRIKYKKYIWTYLGQKNKCLVLFHQNINLPNVLCSALTIFASSITIAQKYWRGRIQVDSLELELIKNEIHKSEEEERQVKAVGMAKQGAWIRWE